MTGAPPARRFRRSLSARVTSLTAFLLFGGALLWRLLAGEFGAGLLAVAALALLGAFGVAGAFGDRVVVDARGVAIENRLWQRLGRAPRRIAWEDVAGLRDQARPSAIDATRVAAVFVIPRRGRPLPIDAIEDLPAARALAQEHLDAARSLSTRPAGRLR